jgi:hypothetical protein
VACHSGEAFGVFYGHLKTIQSCFVTLSKLISLRISQGFVYYREVNLACPASLQGAGHETFLYSVNVDLSQIVLGDLRRPGSDRGA